MALKSVEQEVCGALQVLLMLLLVVGNLRLRCRSSKKEHIAGGVGDYRSNGFMVGQRERQVLNASVLFDD